MSIDFVRENTCLFGDVIDLLLLFQARVWAGAGPVNRVLGGQAVQLAGACVSFVASFMLVIHIRILELNMW